MRSFNLFVGALALTAACGNFGGDDDDDTGLDTDTGADTDVDTDTDEETDIVDVTPEWNTALWNAGWTDAIDCGEGEFTIELETLNWGFDAALYVSQTKFYGAFAAWDELHTLEETSGSDANDGEGFTVFERTLTLDASISEQTADESTLFGCADIEPGSDAQVTFAAAVWAEGDDSSSDDPADCIVFGQDPEELLADGYTGGTGDGADRSLPGWFNDTNCRIVE